MLDRLHEDGEAVLAAASLRARGPRPRLIGHDELLWALTAVPTDARTCLIGFGLEDTSGRLSALRAGTAQQPPFTLTRDLERVLSLALVESQATGRETIDATDLLLALIRDRGRRPGELFGPAASRLTEIRAAIRRRSPYGERLGQAARDGVLPAVLHRDGVLDRMVQILSLRSKNNPVLIGDPGVGVRAVLNGLARRFAAGEVPSLMRERELILIDWHEVITDRSTDFEGRLRAIFEGAAKARTVLLGVHDADRYLDLNPRGEPRSVGSVFWSLIGRGDLQVILCMPPEVYRRHAVRGSVLDTHCRPIPVPELSIAETRAVLESVKDSYEEHHSVVYSDDAITMTAQLAEKYLPDGRLPSKALGLLDEAAANCRFRAQSTPDDLWTEVSWEAVVTTVARLAGIDEREILAAVLKPPDPAVEESRPTTRLPHHATSTALLLGTGAYDDPALPDIPAVANNLADLAAVLTGAHGGFDPARVHRHLDPSITDLPRIAEAAESATDTLLVYFAGHGFVESDGDLYLGLQATELPRRKHSALPYERLRDLVRDSPARNRVVILDCCYAGRAVGTLAEDGDPGGQLDIAGTYILAATSPTRRAHAPAGERHSAFTGALLSLLRQGIDNGEGLIRIAQLFPHLRTALVARGLPAPQQRGTDTVGDLALARNPRV